MSLGYEAIVVSEIQELFVPLCGSEADLYLDPGEWGARMVSLTNELQVMRIDVTSID